MKRLAAIAMAVAALTAGSLVGGAWGATGPIMVTLENRINTGPGDKILVGLGGKDGVIKGDVLEVYANISQALVNPVGYCPVIQVFEKASVCEIAKSKNEIVKGWGVRIEDVRPGDPRLYPYIYRLLSDTVDPYEPQRAVKVLVHFIYNEKNEVTEFSKRLSGQIYDIYGQKKKIVLRGLSRDQGFKLYPHTYLQHYDVVRSFMEKSDIDVIIAGTYRIEGKVADVTLYKVDRTFGEQRLSFTVPTEAADLSEASTVLSPYDPDEIRRYVLCRFVYREIPYVPHKDEKKDIIAYESGGNAFTGNEIRKAAFNIIGPVEPALWLDNERLPMGTGGEVLLPITKGKHRIYASFKRGYFLNNRETRSYTSQWTTAKEAVMEIARDGRLVVQVTMSPVSGKDPIDIQVYREADRERPILRSVESVEAGRSVDYFRD